jgi:hypothetical protein
MTLDLPAMDAALKQYYTDDRVENMVYQDNPLMALMPKMEEFYGKNLPIPIIFGNPQGRSRTFTRAQTRGAATNSKVSDFVLTRVKDYSIADIDNETLEASKNSMGSFLDAATLEVDGAINAVTRNLGISMYRSGYGDIGQIGSISTTTITLSNPNDVTNFEVQQELDLSATQSGALRAYGSSGNGLIITAIDRVNGVLTFGANVTDATNGIPLAAANDYIFVRGDHIASTLTSVAGLEAWVPSSNPSSTSFFGVDRSVDVSRLGGMRYDASALPIEEALIKGASIVAREGWKLDHYFMSFATSESLEKSLGSKVQYVDLKANAEVAFRGVVINGPKGPIKIVPDQNCPSNRVFGLHMPVWKLYSLGKSVRVIDTDGLQMLRQGTADGVEVRYGNYLNMGCRAPGANINLQV